MTCNIHIKYLTTIIVCILALTCQAKKVEDIFDQTFDENLNSPKIVKNEVVQRVQDFQNGLAIELIKSSLEVELTRNGEVIIVTIPADELFAPNDTILKSKSKDILSKLLKFSKQPGMFKVLLAMHSDNTGSREYLMHLTSARVNSVFDWFAANGSTEAVVPYALAGTMPLEDNDSMEKRRLNRRLEIYIVPNQDMVDQAKKGKITGKVVSKKRK